MECSIPEFQKGKPCPNKTN
ncbi:unnamed protein product, partial [Didymodactylos carnosus]